MKTQHRLAVRFVACLVTIWCVGCGAADQTRYEREETPQAVTHTNACPSFNWFRLLPRSPVVGEPTEIVVDVIDPDAPSSELTLAWQAPSGVFSEPELAITDYTCDEQGPQTLTLSAQDALECTKVLDLIVQCLPTR
jgi:hypothetical protein